MDYVIAMADELAVEAIEIAKRTGDDLLVDQIAEVVGASSSTLQEAFMTAVRVRRAEERARAILADRASKAAKQTPAR
ncbi:hypothetical protein [Pseudogemmobacter sp. W21_MBD1_M6]|uniref:hypothetical protein n=1 Tax=Pseudogemmobacter sp. W21_MBD1_M6 TaxID=3240271 RepID=UPI003F999B6F